MDVILDQIEKIIKERVGIYENEMSLLNPESIEAAEYMIRLDELHTILKEIELIRRTENV